MHPQLRTFAFYLRPMVVLTFGLLLTSCVLPWQAQENTGTPTPTPVATELAGKSVEAAPAKAAPTARPIVNPPNFTDITGSADEISGMVIFSSSAANPFPNLNAGALDFTTQERYVWAIAPDGKRAGRLSPEWMGSAAYRPAAPGGKTRVVEYGFALPEDAVERIPLPSECDEYDRCAGFQLSWNGRYMTYFTGEGACGRTLTLSDALSGSVENTWADAHAAYFLQDGSLVVVLGGCQKHVAYLYIPNTGKQVSMGDEGPDEFWSPDRNRFLWQVEATPRGQPALWGIDLKNSRAFLWTTDQLTIQDSPAWTPSGRHFLFQHRAFTYDDKTGDVILSGPRQVILMDSITRSQRQMAYSSQYNYHLCYSAGEPCTDWSGDWIQVRRTRFSPVRMKMDERGSEKARCALYGLDCPEEGELFALNWKTGDMVPWSEAGLDDPTTIAQETPPDLSSAPVYEDADGDFALYTSADGHHLWYVPYEGDPVLWVRNGEGFTYIP